MMAGGKSVANEGFKSLRSLRKGVSTSGATHSAASPARSSAPSGGNLNGLVRNTSSYIQGIGTGYESTTPGFLKKARPGIKSFSSRPFVGQKVPSNPIRTKMPG